MNKYIILSIYFLEKFKNNIDITIKITPREIYLINELKTKILIEINIMKLEEIDILISRSFTLIFSYKIEVLVKLKPKKRAIR